MAKNELGNLLKDTSDNVVALLKRPVVDAIHDVHARMEAMEKRFEEVLSELSARLKQLEKTGGRVAAKTALTPAHRPTAATSSNKSRSFTGDKWIPDRHARRVPNFVIDMTGMKTKHEIVEAFGDDAVFEKDKAPPRRKDKRGRPRQEYKNPRGRPAHAREAATEETAEEETMERVDGQEPVSNFRTERRRWEADETREASEEPSPESEEP